MDTRSDLPHALVPLGEVVDNCRIEAFLGNGAFGAVYRGQHLTLEHPRAFKFLIQRSELSDAQRRRFLAEARHTAHLAHANIVVIHNVGEWQRLPFIHMEFLQGRSLRSAFKSGRVPVERVWRIMDQVLGALGAAHAKNIVHRDIKPDNVMVSDDGNVKVVDFGLSLNIETHASRLTLDSGQVMGTPRYMAPEQWDSTSVGPPADVWSAGVMLYELLTDEAPFQAHTLPDLMRKIKTEAPLPLSARDPRIPAAVSDVVARMLAKNVQKRFADAAQARSALRQALGSRNPQESIIAPSTLAASADGVQLPEGIVEMPGGDSYTKRFLRACDNGCMVLLSGGEFTIGSDEGDADERPPHRVYLSPFLLDQRPVTRRQFATFLTLWGSDRDEHGHPLVDADLAGIQKLGMIWEPESGDDDPITGVTWHGADAYARWAEVQLPSEAQLEAAFTLAAGDDSYGLHDLIGKVRLWCADTYDERYYQRSPQRNPVNVEAGAFRSLRGRSARRTGPAWRLHARQFGAPHEWMLDVGFRCALTLS